MLIRNLRNFFSGQRLQRVRGIMIIRPLTAVVTAVAVFTGMLVPPVTRAADEYQLMEVIDYLSQEHLNGPAKTKLIDAAMKAAIASLNDPYTEYLTEDEWNSFEDVLEQSYVGIGVKIEERDDRFIAVEVFDGSPAAKAGISVNDEFQSVNAKPVKGLSIDKLLELIKGPVNTPVKISVLRAGKTQVFEMRRAKVNAPVVHSRKYENIGFIDVSTFSSEAGNLFNSHLKKLEQQKITGLIVDFRNNSGGILEIARQIASNFIKKGNLIYMRDRSGNRKAYPIEEGSSKSYPVAVLVNEWSASASEVLAGALKDYQLAKIVGKNTFGKGVVQDVFQLENGGYLKITTQEYLTPKLNKVQKVGIKPDRTADNPTAQLVNALRIAGSKSLKMTFDTPSTYILNGVKGSDRTNLYLAKQPNYVHAELLTSFTGSFVAADEKGQLTWTSGGPGVKTVFPKWSVRYQDQNWYIDWSVLSNKFPGVSWKKANGNWQLSYSKAR